MTCALVCGGRNYADGKRTFEVLDALKIVFRIKAVVHGCADGADKIAGNWAYGHYIPCTKFQAEWNKYGLAAGPLRNQQMLDEGKPDLVIAFPGGPGTADMIRRAKREDFLVIEVPA